MIRSVNRSSRTDRDAWLQALIALLLIVWSWRPVQAQDDTTLRVFIFAGQSNMVGSDSKAQNIRRFPPFAGLEDLQPGVRFSYCRSRENKSTPDGWVDLQPVDNVVGPELSFGATLQNDGVSNIAIAKFTHSGSQVSENDMSWGPFRKGAPKRLMSFVTESRKDPGLPSLKWYVSQQPPADDEQVKSIDVTAELETAVAMDETG